MYWKIAHGNARLKPRVPVFLHALREVTNTLPQDTSSQAKETPDVPTSRTSYPVASHKMIQVKSRSADKSTSCCIEITPATKVMKAYSSDSEYLSPSPSGSTESTDETEVDSSSSPDTTYSATSSTTQKNSYVGRKFMISLVEKKPMSYIGVPKQCFWVIEYLSKVKSLDNLSIIITLYNNKRLI